MEQVHTMSRFCHNPSLGLLLIRIVTGFTFVHHGWLKYGNVAGTMKFMAAIGLPEYMAYAIIAVEILGGLMLIFGVLARVAGVATGIAMLVAVALATYPNRGLLGSEFEILLMAVSFGVALTGAGEYRLLHMFEHQK